MTIKNVILFNSGVIRYHIEHSEVNSAFFDNTGLLLKIFVIPGTFSILISIT